MTFTPRMRPLIAVAVLAGLLVIAGCGAGADGSTSPSVSESTTVAAPDESPASEPEPDDDAATCQNTITPEALAAFTGEGWTGEEAEEPWLIAGVAVDGGVQCRWMEDHAVATDNYILTSWAPLTSADSDAAVAALLGEGSWLREDGEAGIYITAEGAEMMPVVDMEGYATTYLFTGDQVLFANTKADLALITAPAGFAP